MNLSAGKKTPLHDRHVDSGGLMMPLSGWIRPVHYGSVDNEVSKTRSTVGLFDLHPLNRVIIEGEDALAFVQLLITGDVEKALFSGRSMYSCICDEFGCLIDDVILFPASANKIIITSGLEQSETINNWIKLWIDKRNFKVSFIDINNSTTQIAIQGPLSKLLLQKTLNSDIGHLDHMHFTEINYKGSNIFIARVGYTGEPGFELIFDIGLAVEIWSQLQLYGEDYGVTPFGIMAAQILRIEKGYLLHGVDMDSTNNPFEIGLGWSVSMSKDDFIGKKPLQLIKNNGFTVLQRKFSIEGEHTFPKGSSIYANNNVIGNITSCVKSPTLGRILALGMFFTEPANNDECYVVFSNHQKKISFSEEAFYDPDSTRLNRSWSYFNS